MPRPPTKRTYKVEKAKTLGRLQAKVEHEYKAVKWLADIIPFLPKKYKKNATLWMKSLLEKHLDKIPKTIALLGLTYIIKELIRTSDELLTKIRTFTGKPIWETKLFEPIWEKELSLTPIWKKPEVKELLPEWKEWLIAFTLAYIIIEHGGQIALGLGETVKGLTGIVGFLLG